MPAPSERWAIFLDLDGTLVGIAATPQAVQIEPELLALLERLRQCCGGALAVVSGRALADIDRLLTPLRLPAAGLHGRERRRADGTLLDSGGPEAIIAPLRPLLAAYVEARPGLLLEDKGGSLALHYRLAPTYAASVCRLARRLAGEERLLRVIFGRKVVEFQPRGSDKGAAIAAFLAEPPFAGRRPVYAGDDATDEDGFAVVNRLGGLSIKVLNGERRAPASAAQFQLRSVTALHRWLAAIDRALAPALLPTREGTAALDDAFS
ncbi:MAG TPA: trehalose-phosphatase [Stellaceae bacterium]|nr:trehalose-phosphatase [Stellaceae bacterium]